MPARAAGLQRGAGGRRLRRLRAELPGGNWGHGDLWHGVRADGGGAQCLGGTGEIEGMKKGMKKG